MTPEDTARINAAIQTWFTSKERQAAQSLAAGNAQGGTRAAVTGGGHLNGFEQLIVDEIYDEGLTDLVLYRNRAAKLPGWYRATKDWDLLIARGTQPLLAVEFKSQAGSIGNNLNNRADEMFGVAEDARGAEANGLLPPQMRRAYIYILELTNAALTPVRATTRFGRVDPVFQGASYWDRIATMLDRARGSGLYHAVWAVGAKQNPYRFEEHKGGTVGWDQFSADLRSGFVGGQPTIAPHP